jgi:hypothetical protein
MEMSQWAGYCRRCGTDLRAAPLIVNEDWDAALLANRGHQRRWWVSQPMAAAAVLVVALVVAGVAVNATGGSRRSGQTVLCRAPTAVWQPANAMISRPPGLAAVGPINFDAVWGGVAPIPPTRLVVHAVRAVVTALTMRGWNCDSGKELRFSDQPVASSTLRAAPIGLEAHPGSATVTLPPMAPGDDVVGYARFTPGRWDVEVWQGAQLVGNVVFLLPTG